MNRSTPFLFKPTLFLSTLLGGFLLTSCGAPVQDTAQAPLPEAAEAPVAGDASVTPQAASEPPLAPNSPQLVKTAEIALVVNAIDHTLQQVSQTVKQHQGDVLGLQNDKPQNRSRETASLQIRVPQAKLESTLDALAQLGTVQRRNLTAEDVTDQLVDFQARSRNLRRQESMLLEIMDRSGSVGDVLKVAQELSNVRQSIEQIDAQLKSLTNRVAYSTITVQLEAAVSTTTPPVAVGLQVRDTWNNATQSVGEFTTNLAELAIWLVAYSPYLLLIGGAMWLSHTRKKPSKPTPPASDSHLAP